MDLGVFLHARLDEEEKAYAMARHSELGLAEHLAHWTPGRLTRDVEARRRMVDLCVEVVDVAEVGDREDLPATAGLALELLCVMATPYQDHADYQPAWRPEARSQHA